MSNAKSKSEVEKEQPSDMPVFNPTSACPDLKVVYETCFQKWYTEEFLHGAKKAPCDAQFSEYQRCVVGVIDERGLANVVFGEAAPVFDDVNERDPDLVNLGPHGMPQRPAADDS
jgi:hypothetical protein